MRQLSVIIPLYNCEQYICQAIDSVLNQKGVDVELLVVNDGSTDNSLEKVSFYRESIRVISINNSGASVARNIGLKESTGKYVMFLDADDFLNDVTICQRTIKEMETQKVNMGMFSYTYFNNSNGTYTLPTKYPSDIHLNTDAKGLISKIVQNGSFYASPCFKIIKRHFLISNNILFIEGTTAEDIEWYCHLLSELDRFCILNDNSYVYRKNISSSVTGSFNLIKCKNHLKMISESIRNVSSIKDVQKKTALFAALAYQYCILLSNCYGFYHDKVLVKETKSLSWLLSYDLYPRIKYVKILYKFVGYYFTSCLLHIFQKHCAKSA